MVALKIWPGLPVSLSTVWLVATSATVRAPLQQTDDLNSLGLLWECRDNQECEDWQKWGWLHAHQRTASIQRSVSLTSRSRYYSMNRRSFHPIKTIPLWLWAIDQTSLTGFFLSASVLQHLISPLKRNMIHFINCAVSVYWVDELLKDISIYYVHYAQNCNKMGNDTKNCCFLSVVVFVGFTLALAILMLKLIKVSQSNNNKLKAKSERTMQTCFYSFISVMLCTHQAQICDTLHICIKLSVIY